jgi:hypothetical protein
MPDDPAVIAEGLSEAQRRAIKLLDRDWRFLPLADRPDKTHPIIELWNAPYRGFQFRLTPLGAAVRRAIEGEGE